jgi:hypothetical protein
MKHFLLVYRRSTGELARLDDLGLDRSSALKRRFEIELQDRSDPDLEVVLLSAPSLDALRRTHGRYFRSPEELAAELGAALVN